jgi:hypothetical protein
VPRRCSRLRRDQLARQLDQPLSDLGGGPPGEHRRRDLEDRVPPLLALLQIVVEPGVLDRRPRHRRETDDEVLVLGREGAPTLLLGQVEVAERLLADPDGRPEERVHRRVVGGEPVRIGMRHEVVDATRGRLLDQEAEHPAARREVADPGGGGLVDAPVDEGGQPLAILGDDPQRAVPRVHEGARGLDDPPQHGLEIEVTRDGQDRVEQAAQSHVVGHVRGTFVGGMALGSLASPQRTTGEAA